MTRVNRVGAAAAVLGPALLFVYYWSEEAFGPSQPNGGPLRGALGIQLITGALICFAIALLRLRAEGLNGDSRTARLSTWLGRLAVGLLLIGSALWWPILFYWPDFGPVAGAPVALGLLTFLGTWFLVGLGPVRERDLFGWARPLPLGLFALFFLLLYVTGTGSSWPVVAAVLGVFSLGWLLLAYVMQAGRISERAEATPVASPRMH
ncbi:MAG: hypothetical protein AABM32_12635 [Chloroflexota bacterium]